MNANTDELRRLVSRYCDGALDPAQAAQLRTLLCDDDNCRLFIRYLDVHARLSWEFGAAADAERDGAPRPAARAGRRRVVRLPKAAAWVSIAAAVVGAIVVFGWLHIARRGAKTGPAAATAHPVLVRSIGARWRGAADYRVGDAMPPGPLELLCGAAVLETAGGARLVLEAPVRLECIDAARAFLRAGKIFVRADTAAGFTVDSEQVTVVDEGTEFGVSSGPGGDTVVQVFSGKVTADFKNNTRGPARRMQLIGGEACGLTAFPDAVPHRLPFKSERFVRTFPEPEDGTDFTPAFQTRSRTETITIRRAPTAVAVDGVLSEWDRDSVFFSQCDRPYEKSYTLRGAMMYDRRYLYIGAAIGDPAPLRSVIPPDADSTYCYRGGAVQVRVCTDPAKPWPLPDYWSARRQAGPDDPPLDFLVHLSLWYSAPADRPCLHIGYGIPPLRERPAPPAGWRGAFKKDPDGLGYTLEYAISWDLLQAKTTPFAAGDETAVCWQINWADRAGRVRVAQLNECVNRAAIRDPEDLINCWRQTASWGRGVFAGDRAE